MAKFNHMYDLAFSVVSKRADGSDVTPTMMRQALLRRIADLDNEEPYGGWEEACGLCDTYREED